MGRGRAEEAPDGRQGHRAALHKDCVRAQAVGSSVSRRGACEQRSRAGRRAGGVVVGKAEHCMHPRRAPAPPLTRPSPAPTTRLAARSRFFVVTTCSCPKSNACGASSSRDSVHLHAVLGPPHPPPLAHASPPLPCSPRPACETPTHASLCYLPFFASTGVIVEHMKGVLSNGNAAGAKAAPHGQGCLFRKAY